jgi:hypothetical protein
VTLKVREEVGSLRRARVARALADALRKARAHEGLRLLRCSIRDDEAHMIVQADSPEALGRGMKSLAARFARAVNRALRRSGAVLRDRYELRVPGA